MTFFTDRFAGNIFLIQRVSVSTSWIAFSTQVRSDKPMFSPFIDSSSTKNVSLYLWQYTRTAGPHYLNLLNQLMAIRSSSGFSHLQPGAFHIPLQTHKTQDTQPRGWKERKTKQARTWVSSKRKKEEVFNTFLLSSSHLGAIACVYPSEIPSQPPGTPTHPLTLADLASESTGPNS